MRLRSGKLPFLAAKMNFFTIRERRFTMQSDSSFAAAVYVAARETPI
jgi:hypothetical protein